MNQTMKEKKSLLRNWIMRDHGPVVRVNRGWVWWWDGCACEGGEVWICEWLWEWGSTCSACCKHHDAYEEKSCPINVSLCHKISVIKVRVLQCICIHVPTVLFHLCNHSVKVIGCIIIFCRRLSQAPILLKSLWRNWNVLIFQRPSLQMIFMESLMGSESLSPQMASGELDLLSV